MATESRPITTSVPLVAIASWLLPGSGYVLIGQAWRGILSGTTVILLFLFGLLIGGVRVIEVPGYRIDNGQRQMVILPRGQEMWSLTAQPLAEIRDKPWSVPQVMTGPIAVVAGAASVYAAGPADESSKTPIAPQTHSRINELGSLYLSVAGLLNLMMIIDAAFRASQLTQPPETSRQVVNG